MINLRRLQLAFVDSLTAPFPSVITNFSIRYGAGAAPYTEPAPSFPADLSPGFNAVLDNTREHKAGY